MKEPVVIIVERLRAARVETGLTQAQVATKAKLKPDYIAKIETGHDPNLTVPALIKWCNALGVSPAQIVANLTPEARRR
jgi:transcriptional regulator with XRE-family HTH domain